MNSEDNRLNELIPSRKTSTNGISPAASQQQIADTIARMQYGVETSFKSRLQQYFIENQKSSLRIRLFNVFIKLLSCIIYCVRVVNDSRQYPKPFPYTNKVEVDETITIYDYLLWVDFDRETWLIQTIVATISMAETVLIFYLSYSIFIPSLRNLFVPVFLNCWLAKGALQAMMNDLNRSSFISSSALFRQLLLLFSVLICLIFTGMCSIEHLQRARGKRIDLFSSFYFVMVTFSTVGYGDWYPDYWMSQLCVVILICVALGLIPKQLEELGQTWSERQKSGTDFGGWSGGVEEHVVVTITFLEVEFIRDFLEEFYAHPENQRVQVVLLSPAELDNQTRMLLKIPLWNNRVHYVRGSSLRDEDLERAKVANAKACFVLSARHVNRKVTTDEHTILRSWAIKDFAPNVKQYVQIFRAETKMHIEHAEVLICEDEFKYALLANNCICPGISTFITLLMHTSRGEEGQKSTEPWHKVYGFHSGNEMYQIKVMDSKFFGDFVDKSFSYTSFHAHKAYGIGLIAVSPDGDTSQMKMNPGLNHIIKPNDIVYYMGLTNEESLFDFRKDLRNQQRRANVASTIANIGSVAMDMPTVGKTELNKRKKKKKEKAGDEINLIEVGDQVQSSRRPSIAMVTEGKLESSSDSDTEEYCEKCRGVCIQHKLQRSYPQVRTYIGTSNTVCHMMKEKRNLCCLKLDQKCAHKSATAAHEYQWRNRPIILAADKTSSGMYNLVIPLRAYYRPVHDLHPIILLLELSEEDSLNPAFLDAIAYFPDIYWMKGKIGNLDCLLRAGVSNAEHVVVVKETAVLAEEHFADCSTIITVQKIHRMFPRLRMITELTHATNMRFVQFNPNNAYSLAQSRFEKKERKRGSHMPFMFRLPFAQGGVFSANMMDRLLYQAMIKPFVVDLVRLLLGIDQTSGGGYLTSFVITEEDLWIKNYGRLYQKLCSSVADIPIGIFRTKRMDAKTVSLDLKEQCKDYELSEMERNKDMYDHVKNRMRILGIKESNTLIEGGDDMAYISYVIINPAPDLVLEARDIVYVIRSPIRKDATNKRINPRRGLRRSRNVTETMDGAPGIVPTIVIDENDM
ncbi:unnamed protein product [Caenorhabditis bovis]|uniref:RCK N-terminal domain-containing protein n=1 Tax=Caenorhabditis bovis TaxID=2654633 RepID=A0A8S1ENS5_9PELO|nr:unnamed protein product [Caenorhabditis bovis]